MTYTPGITYVVILLRFRVSMNLNIHKICKAVEGGNIMIPWLESIDVVWVGLGAAVKILRVDRKVSSPSSMKH